MTGIRAGDIGKEEEETIILEPVDEPGSAPSGPDTHPEVVPAPVPREPVPA